MSVHSTKRLSLIMSIYVCVCVFSCTPVKGFGVVRPHPWARRRWCVHHRRCRRSRCRMLRWHHRRFRCLSGNHLSQQADLFLVVVQAAPLEVTHHVGAQLVLELPPPPGLVLEAPACWTRGNVRDHGAPDVTNRPCSGIFPWLLAVVLHPPRDRRRDPGLGVTHRL
jgi:hypothetical protein